MKSWLQVSSTYSVNHMRRLIIGALLLPSLLLVWAQNASAFNRYRQNPAELNLLESVFVNPAFPNNWQNCAQPVLSVLARKAKQYFILSQMNG